MKPDESHLNAHDLVDRAWPPEIQKLRAATWSVVNWVLPLQVRPAAQLKEDYVAAREQLLPRVPVAGEWLLISDGRVPVERVEWSPDVRVQAVLKGCVVKPEHLEHLKSAGWKVFRRRDVDAFTRQFVESL